MDILNPESWKKELAAKRFVRRGHATLKELIELNYGEWPLRGLSIASDEHLNQRVTIMPMRRWWWRQVSAPQQSNIKKIKAIFSATTKSLCSAGLATHGDEREIALNGFMRIYYYCCGRMITNRLLAHERRHVHQFDAVVPSRKEQIFGISIAGLPEASADTIINAMMTTGMHSASPLRRQFEHLLYKFSHWMHENTGKELRKIYFRRGVEIQARMEEFLVQGYPHWTHMPLNRAELYASLWNVGIRPPKLIGDRLKADLEFQLAVKQFKAPPYTDAKALYGLRMAIKQLPGKEVKNLFWNVALPALYGDILETMGDSEGRTRMWDKNNPENNGWSPDQPIFTINGYLIPLCLGKLLDRSISGDKSPALEADIAQAACKVSPLHLASNLANMYDFAQRQAAEKGEKEISSGYQRFILACLQAPRVMEILETHKPPLFDWISSQSVARRQPRSHPATSPTSRHHL